MVDCICLYCTIIRSKNDPALFLTGLFSHTTKTIDNEDFVQRHRTNNSAFTRNRKFCFKDLLVVLMSFTRPSVKTELDRFFKRVSKSPESFDSISKSAFTQARKKLNPGAFIELRKQQLNYFNSSAPVKKSWKGHRVIGVDGSKKYLPFSKELKSYFGLMKNQHNVQCVGALASIVYDVCNDLILDADIGPFGGSEVDMAVKHLDFLDPERDVLVFDRGYPSVWFMALLMKRGFKFCFRLSTSWNESKKMQAGGETDIDWTAKKNSRRKKEKFEEFDLPKEVDGLRLVCIELPTGEKEVLATNLTDREIYSIEDLKELYRLRWGTEVTYRVLKEVLEVEYFTGKSIQSIMQDFHAKVFMANLGSIIETQGLDGRKQEKEKTNKYKLKVNKTQTLAKMKDFLVDLFYSDKPLKLIKQLLFIVGQSFDIVRPNRSFSRKTKLGTRKKKYTNIRGI